MSIKSSSTAHPPSQAGTRATAHTMPCCPGWEWKGVQHTVGLISLSVAGGQQPRGKNRKLFGHCWYTYVSDYVNLHYLFCKRWRSDFTEGNGNSRCKCRTRIDSSVVLECINKKVSSGKLRGGTGLFYIHTFTLVYLHFSSVGFIYAAAIHKDSYLRALLGKDRNQIDPSKLVTDGCSNKEH